MKEKIIEFKNFSFKYQAQQVPTLEDINLTIYKGEKVLIAGPSGSGKSTLAHCLNGIVPNIYAGEMTGDLTIAGSSAFGRSIYELSLLTSTVLQDTDGQFIGLSVAEDLAFALENDQVAGPEMRKRVKTWARRLDLTDLLAHRPQDLSGGQKQRVSLAGVLIDESPILLFDEPLANLDPKAGQDTIALIDQLHRSQGTTTIIIEHRLEDVLYRPLDRIILVNDGRLVFNGRPDELLATQLLTENGIREPLYLTTLRQLGYTLTPNAPLSNLAALDLPALPLVPEGHHPKQTTHREILLVLENLSFSYPKKSVLQDLSLTVYAGEKIAIVGQNGAGKSTLAKLLCQFLPMQTGRMIWRGQDLAQESVKERAEKIGFVLQNPNQMISQTMIYDEVALGLRLRGLPEVEIEPRVFEVLKTCGLYAYRNWPISALSFGQKKRVTIAAILVLGAQMLILDEPTAGQDERNYTKMMDFLDELNQAGTTIVMITHDMQLMMDYTDRTLVIGQGQIIADSTPIDILSQPELVEAAHLKTTSIFQLAEKISLDPVNLTHYYMEKRGCKYD